MSTFSAAEIGRHHLGHPVAVNVPTSEGIKHVEGTLRWFAHHEDNLAALGIEDPRTGVTDEWQMPVETLMSVYVSAGGASNGE